MSDSQSNNVVSIKQAAKVTGSCVREEIIDALVEVITEEGFVAATNRRIAERAKVSVGTVQYHFSTKAHLFEIVLQRCHQEFLLLVADDALLSGKLESRVNLFVVMSWRHYQSKLYLATIEILMATRSQREIVSLVELTEHQAVEQRRRIRQIFPECQLDDRALSEVLTSTHVFLTGLTVETLLKPKLVNIGGYLRRCTRAMVVMLKAPV
ncbi:MAG: TetR/AcrR family transcriptional regulator [Oceanicoccus sp.]|uniref:TetR/AcrR family transcriptional regulator n=1 Tax=Oceanicoccus sp. TaxID=2691044 RepID=UPI002621AADE|nr:TetR/AcrR family transcriptional regulator [Oceanicoccus sp.]MCP3908348.1 TetR/AcrR family transcriptional regulator [Oceanicoccus sp.]MDG1773320.1 TetR/AcrR family transcriptional regulator [Oceanicoccus sp.]